MTTKTRDPSTLTNTAPTTEPVEPEASAAPVKPTTKEVRQPQPGDEGASTDDGSGGASAP